MFDLRFPKADITKTNFRGADLQGVRGLIRVEWKGLTHYIQKDKIRIDCMTRTVREWVDAPDEELWALIKKHNIQATPDEHRAIWKLAELLTGE